MDNDSINKSTRPAAPRSELLQAVLAIVLAVASQLAVQDGFALMGLAGYVIAALLFVTSVAAIFKQPAVDEPTSDELTLDEPAGDELTADEATSAEEGVEPAKVGDGANKLSFLRHHWRLATIAEIVSGDIPPARVGIPEADEVAMDEPEDGRSVAGVVAVVATTQEDAPTAEAPDAPPQVATEMQSETAAAAAASAPKAIKVTADGDVLVLNTGLEQMQRFDEQGNLLASYALAGLADMVVLDLDVSPDGKTLYLVDGDSRLRVISLVDEDSTRGEKRG